MGQADEPLALSRQCLLAGVARSGAYVRLCPAREDEEDQKSYISVLTLIAGLTEYFLFYNTERPHQALDYCTPDEVYRTGVGGSARIVDKFNVKEEASSTVETGQRCAAA